MDIEKQTRSFSDRARRVLSPLLTAVGFQVGRGMRFIRRDNEYVNIIKLQTAQHVPSYTSNIGFHYTWLPSCFHLVPMSQDNMKIDLLDFVMFTRLGKLDEHVNRDTWWPCDCPWDEVKDQLVKVATESVQACDTFCSTYSDPKVLLRECPPAIVQSVLNVRNKGSDKARIVDAANHQILDLFPSPFNMLFCLCHVAARFHNTKLLREYLSISEQQDLFDDSRDALRKLAAEEKVSGRNGTVRP